MKKLCRYGCGRHVENPTTTRCRTCRRQDKRRSQSVVRPGGPRVLLIDIETAPMVVYTWGLWQQNIGINQIIEPTRMICFSAKWLGEPETFFWSEHEHGQSAMVANAWLLLDKADVVVHFYGSRFDIPHLNREFLAAGHPPPSPYKQVDLKLAVSKRFKFPSNKLQFVSQALGLSGKENTGGFELWRSCLQGDAAAWKRMEKYNRRDVTLLEEVYEALLPWIPGVPSRHLYPAGGSGCPACGHHTVAEAGVYRTKMSVYPQYACGECGSQFRGTKRLYGIELTEVAL